MTIKELKQIVDKAYEKGKECEVEFWINLDDGENILAELEGIGQFSVIPDMTLTLKPSNKENKIYTTKIVDEKQFDYRKAYQELTELISKIYFRTKNVII